MTARVVAWGSILLVVGTILGVAAAGVVHDDEGYHLLAARLLRAGWTPYRDFVYQQTPLLPVVLAGIHSLFGATWRSSHLELGLGSSAAILLAAAWLAQRIPDATWRPYAFVCTLLFVGLNHLVLFAASWSLPYAAIQLCLLIPAFVLTTLAATQITWIWAALAGFLMGCSMACCLLTALVGPVAALWLACTAKGARWRRVVAFGAGWLIPLVVVLYVALLAPRLAWFNLVEFHLVHRRTDFSTGQLAYEQLRVLSAWLTCPQSMVLVLCTGLGWYSLADKAIGVQQRAELWLSFGFFLAVAVIPVFSIPTFADYFSMATPFLALPATYGAIRVGQTMAPNVSPFRLLAPLLGLYLLGLCYNVHAIRSLLIHRWPHLEQVAHQVKALAPDGSVYAKPELYFVSGLIPPPALETKLPWLLFQGPEGGWRVCSAADLHREWMTQGRFALVVVQSPLLDDSLRRALEQHYRGHKQVPPFDIFWRTE